MQGNELQSEDLIQTFGDGSHGPTVPAQIPFPDCPSNHEVWAKSPLEAAAKIVQD